MVEGMVNYINEKEEKSINLIMDTLYPDVEYEINNIARAIYLKNCVVLYSPEDFQPCYYIIKKDGTRILMDGISIDDTIKRYCSIEEIRTIIER